MVAEMGRSIMSILVLCAEIPAVLSLLFTKKDSMAFRGFWRILEGVAFGMLLHFCFQPNEAGKVKSCWSQCVDLSYFALSSAVVVFITTKLLSSERVRYIIALTQFESFYVMMMVTSVGGVYDGWKPLTCYRIISLSIFLLSAIKDNWENDKSGFTVGLTVNLLCMMMIKCLKENHMTQAFYYLLTFSFFILVRFV